uniref:Uncharacterized protein n=1 Tax=Sphenodon punctatus TaxID=8508 RepID=A0A8D0HI70_SPHPU
LITFFNILGMMYIYKRHYVHFPMIFLRQNCDHICIIKIRFNPLPMEIFWKKPTLYIQFLKDKRKCFVFFLKLVFCVNCSF